MLKFLASFVVLFWCSNALAVCDATLTVCSSGCDYNVLNNAVTDLETNCASPSSPLTIEISGSWSSADTTAVDISGITTSATNTLTIYTTGDARHDGRAKVTSGRSSYVLSISRNSGSALGISVEYVTIDGIELILDSWAAYAPQGIGVGNNCIVKNNIIHGGTHPEYLGIGINASTSQVFNNIIYNFTYSAASGISSDYVTASYHSNTIYGCTGGIRAVGHTGTSVTVKNNLCYNNTKDYVGSFTSSSTNNLSKDATAPAYGTYYRNKTLTFVNTTAGSEDFHLVSTDTDAIDKGADLSGTFTTDIDGTTRSGTWDIGADEYVSAGATSATVILGNAVLNNARLLQ